MTLGNYIINYMTIGLVIVMFIILSIIYLQGKAECTEPRKPILITKLILMIAILWLAVYNITNFHYG